MTMAYIRKSYLVPAKRGGRVEYTGEGPDKPELGTITSARGARLMIRLDKSPRFPLPFHPTWRLRYLASEKGQADG